MVRYSRDWIENNYSLIGDNQVYNLVVTAHAFLVIFYSYTYLNWRVWNWSAPLILGARDIAFPRINNRIFWFLIPALVILYYPGL
ncbi:MAG: cbb3-type cytochrome c oxidase subunit I [bacterium]